MTTAVQHRRGTTAEHAAFTGLEGELTIDTTKDTAVIHDGTLAGGYPLAKENLANVTTSGLSSIDGASTASDDKFFIYDQSATSLKTITRAELNNAIEQDTLANVAITGGTINGTTIGGTTAAAVSSTTLTTSSTVTHNGGTANGVAYLNGSKVLTTGSALTFDGTKLVATATTGAATTYPAYFDNSGGGSGTGARIGFRNTGASYGEIGYLYDGTFATIIDSAGSSNTRFLLGGSEQMRLTSTGLGIGTSSSAAKLNVNGDALFNGTTKVTSSAVEIQGDMTLGNYAAYSTSNYRDILYSASTASFGNQPTANIRFQTTSDIGAAITFLTRNSAGDYAERMRLDQVGNLGLGVTPSAWDTIKPIEIARAGSFVGANSSGSTYLGTNTRYSGGSWRYANDGAAGLYTVEDNIHFWRTAPSGTAGDAISFTQAMTLDASGNLGVGTTSPTSTYSRNLHINGSVSAGVRFTSTSYTDGFDVVLSAGDAYLLNRNSTSLIFGTSGTERARIDSSGNVGIGTSSPVEKVQSSNGIAATGANQSVGSLNGFVADYSSGVSRLFASRNGVAAGTMTFWTTDSTGTAAERMRLDASGNLGLGVTPSTGGYGVAFQFGQAGDGGALTAQAINTNNYPVNLTAGAISSGVSTWKYSNQDTSSATRYEQVGGQHAWYTAPSGTAGAAITFTQAMTLDASGNLMRGQTSTGLENSNGIALDTAGYIVQNHSGTASGVRYAYFGYNGSEIGSISQNGTTAVAYNTSSDYRLKNITGPITTSGAYIDSLNPVEGTWKADGSTFVGLIAHEVQEASRTTVATGVKDGEQMQGMDYSSAEIIANLIAEVKSLRQRLAAAGI